MDKDFEKVKELSALFRKCADILDEIITIADSGDEEGEERIEQLFGQFMITMMKLEALKGDF